MTVKPIDVLLKRHAGCITQINELTGLSSTNFDRYYLSAIQCYARFVQQLPASEVHHHAGVGGMLTHALEVCVIALKVRRSYLFSETGGAEEISQKQDLWTYAVFIAALCHDLAKVAVDQVLTIYDENNRKLNWEPWDQFIDEQGQWYTSEFVRNRQYRLHEKASSLLVYKIVPSCGMTWISSDQRILSSWLSCLYGDLENASFIGEIVSLADGKSVAANLGADNSRMPTVKTKPLHEKMLTALRHLLLEGELPLNRNGAAGWVKDDDCWLVSKRTVDAIREQLIQEGHSGIPTKNGRMFDVLQEHGVIIPHGKKAIWPVTVEAEGWSNELTMIRIAVNKIWNSSTNRPDDFEGRIIVAEVIPIEDIEKVLDKTIALKEKQHKKDTQLADTESTESVKEIITCNQLVEKVKNEPLESLDQDGRATLGDDLDLLTFLPSINTSDEDGRDSINVDEIKINKPNPAQSKTTKTIAQLEVASPVYKKSKEKPMKHKASVFGSLGAVEENKDQVSLFFQWLQYGIQTGSLKTNQVKARIHTVLARHPRYISPWDIHVQRFIPLGRLN